jgi:hypothetical protein
MIQKILGKTINILLAVWKFYSCVAKQERKGNDAVESHAAIKKELIPYVGKLKWVELTVNSDVENFDDLDKIINGMIWFIRKTSWGKKLRNGE